MATNKLANDLTKLLKKIEKAIDSPRYRREFEQLGEFAVNLIVKRTRLGYGVRKNGGKRFRLAPLDSKYVDARKRQGGLSKFARPKKSNLTRTGQMLESVEVLEYRRGKLKIGPNGRRRDGIDNADLAIWNANRKGRIFNRLSDKEYNQLRRFYRKTFGDLLKKRRLLR